MSKEKTALESYREMNGDRFRDPVERLRFFLSFAIKTSQDWLDLEQFIDALIKPNADPDAFEEFWQLYPRKDSKKKARTAFMRLTKAKQEAAIDDIKTRYIGVERQFIPIPTTYIHGERWEDEKPQQESNPWDR